MVMLMFRMIVDGSKNIFIVVFTNSFGLIDFILLNFDEVQSEGLSRNIYTKCNNLSLNPDLYEWIVLGKVIILRIDYVDGDREKHLVHWEDILSHHTHL
jgi:hypothetical protein|tara:strand:- start:313 stop:609 length:297 start_codon:yes stop_codon:yes gene_type:complete